MKDNSCRFRALGLALALATGSARGVLLVYDGLPVTGDGAYVSGSNLGNQNPGHASIIGGAGAWVSSTTAIRVAPGGLSYPAGIGLVPQEGMARLLQAGNTGAGTRTSRREISPHIAQSFYMSVLAAFHPSTLPAPNDSPLPYYLDGHYGVFGLANATTGSGAVPSEAGAVYVGFVKRAGGTVDAILKVNADIHVIQADVSPATYLFAVKFTHDAAGDDTVQAALVTTPEEPTAWTVTVTAPVIDGTAALRHATLGGYWQTFHGIDFDEWRVGTTYADVLGLAGGGPSFSGLATVQDVATTGATLTAPIGDAGDPAAALWAYWGESNGGETPSAWSHSVQFGTAVDNTLATFSSFSPALTANTFYYYRVSAENEAGKAWAISTPAYFMTAPVTVTAPASIPENSLSPATFTLHRPAEAVALPLTVPYAIGGTAVPGQHIVSNYTGFAQFAALSATATVPVQPLPDWASSEERTVVLTLQPGAYATSSPNSATVTLTNATLPEAPTNAWMGSVSALASEPANWSLGVVPGPAHYVLVTPAYARRNLQWDVDAPAQVASWTQPIGSTNTVTFHTTPAAPLAIAGDAVLAQGTWTHAGPSDNPVAAVAVDIGGNLLLSPDAAIDANSKGWINRAGPGFLLDSGSSYAGEGWLGGVTYGSALEPSDHGSGARGSGADAAKYAGGGLVRLRVAGTAALHGSITANGYGYNNNGGGSTGGTIDLAAARFEGNGVLTASGGGDTYAGSGSGGRIRLRATAADASFDGFGATVRTEGSDGDPSRGTGGSASGTVFRQTAADGTTGGRLVFENVGNSRDATNGLVRATHLAAGTGAADDLRNVDCVVRGNARLRVTADARLRSLAVEKTLPTSSPRIFLGGHTVRVNELRVLGLEYPRAAYEAADLPVGLFFGSGMVVVGDRSTLLLIR